MSDGHSTIDDLLKKSKLPSVTSADAQAKFSAKMRELDLQAKERETAKRGQLLGVAYINLKGFPISPEALVRDTSDPPRDGVRWNPRCPTADGSRRRSV